MSTARGLLPIFMHIRFLERNKGHDANFTGDCEVLDTIRLVLAACKVAQLDMLRFLTVKSNC